VVTAEGAGLLLGDPAYDGLLPVADVAAELDMRDSTVPRMLAHPTDRNAQQLGDVGGGEKTVAHNLAGRRSISAYIDRIKLEWLD
jgi:hypothetical protein